MWLFTAFGFFSIVQKQKVASRDRPNSEARSSRKAIFVV